MNPEPTKSDITDARYYVGLNKPKTLVIREAPDKYLYVRLKQARKLGVTMDELNDEPDELSDHSDQQEYDDD